MCLEIGWCPIHGNHSSDDKLSDKATCMSSSYLWNCKCLFACEQASRSSCNEVMSLQASGQYSLKGPKHCKCDCNYFNEP